MFIPLFKYIISVLHNPATVEITRFAAFIYAGFPPPNIEYIK